MASHNEIGKKGEKLAIEYVENTLKYKVVETNFRVGRAEVDIIALDSESNYHIIEVKTRQNKTDRAEESVNEKKLKLLFYAMSEYKVENQIEAEFFIDIIAISGDIKSPDIQYFKDVYYEID